MYTHTKQYPDCKEVTETLVLECRGCREIAVLRDNWQYETLEAELKKSLQARTYSPPRLWLRRPDWIDRLEDVDNDLKGLLEEIYSAANDTQVRLLSMGVRTALDHMMNQMLEGDAGNFEDKLKTMVKCNFLTTNQSENLKVVLDAGSATSHRAYKPPRELLEVMVGVVEGLIRDYYISGPMLKTARKLIPPRPPRA
tara:strand:+ start:363 stop:953 length:591 start_codon:yes stop_codon:yes gene_type:complete